MKIAYLYDNFPAYRKDFFSQLSKELSKKGHEFTFVYIERGNAPIKSNVTGVSVQTQRTDVEFNAIPCNLGQIKILNLFILEYFKRFKEVITALKPDAIVVQFNICVLSYWWLYFYCKKHKIPFIFWGCNYTRDTLKSWLVKIRRNLIDFIYLHSTACITYGTIFRDYLINLGQKPENVFVAQNTINVEKLMEQRSSSCTNRNFSHPIHFLYVGALIHRKFVLPAVEAVTELINDGQDIYFDIVGKGSEFDSLKMYINAHNMGERILLHGAKHGDEVKMFFENSDVFILPGTGGLAINEAMAYCLPIISTTGDETVPDLIDGNGYLLKNFGDKEEIKKTIRQFLSLSEEEKKKMASKSEEILRAKATMQNLTNQHIAAIERAIEINHYHN